MAESVVPQPELMGWNAWQSWRANGGGKVGGTRGREEQNAEVSLWRAAMAKYYGQDWRTQLRTPKAPSVEERVAAATEVRRLFPSVRSTTAGSRDASAPKASSLLRRAMVLLPDMESYGTHLDAVKRACILGKQVFPDTFTEAMVKKLKARVCLLMAAYETIARTLDAREDPPGRDHPDVGKTLVDAFLDRFGQETSVELFSPHGMSLYEAYEELLETYEQMGAKELLEASRIAAKGDHEEEPEEFRRPVGPRPRAQQHAAAAPCPREPDVSKGPN